MFLHDNTRILTANSLGFSHIKFTLVMFEIITKFTNTLNATNGQIQFTTVHIYHMKEHSNFDHWTQSWLLTQ